MNTKEVNELLKLFDLRERLILKFAVIAGMRPGEIVALQRGDVSTSSSANVCRRAYRGDLDTPKTNKSIRLAGLPEGLMRDLEAWLKLSPDTGSNRWLFPSEKLAMPLRQDNFWTRHIRPKLSGKGLDWVTFQVLRRTNATIMKQNNVDPKVAAAQLGHTLDVNLNV